MNELVPRRESLRRLCARLGVSEDIADAASDREGGDSFWPGYWDELVDAVTGEPPAGTVRWMRRNRDKPHRCPICHRVVTWHRERYGPRTRLKCTRCGVQWRAGVRVYPWPLRALRRR